MSDTAVAPVDDNTQTDSASEKQEVKTKVAPVELPVALNNLNMLVIKLDVQLESTFASDQLHFIAKKDSLALFMSVYINIFGPDIPSEAYEALYNDAQADAAILKAKYKVVYNLPEEGRAAFNSDTQTILVTEDLILEAIDNNDTRGLLMTILVEEYGHYLDWLLRNHYSTSEKKDAEGDEGAKFAYKMYVINPLEQSDQYFADVTVDEQKTQLVWDFSEFHNDLKQYVNEERQEAEDKEGELEFFKAGKLHAHGHYGHQDITEKALIPRLQQHVQRNKVQQTVDTIYLGNWLRDFSQAVDPMIVRPLAYGAGFFATRQIPNITYKENTVVTGEAPTFEVPEEFFAKLNPANYITTYYFEFRPVTLSVEMVTTAVELAATKEFIHKPGTTANQLVNYKGHLNKLRTQYTAITPDTLGVYRPEEHIDNPMAVGQNGDGTNRGDKQLYSKFVGFVPDSHSMHKINTTFGMKNYIRSTEKFSVEGSSYLSSYDYIISKLRSAAVRGGLQKPKALIDFGAAMHTLEDYFAHSNYVEVSLIKSVEPMVFPWVDDVQLTGFKYSYNDLYDNKGYDDKYIVIKDRKSIKPSHKLASYIPIVTGTFGLVDTAASVLPIINEHVFNIEPVPWDKAKPGERYFADIMIREVLMDFDKAQKDKFKNKGSNDTLFVDSFDAMLDMRDKFVSAKDWMIPDGVESGIHWLMQHIMVLFSFTQHFIVKLVAANLNDAQVLLDKDLHLLSLGSFHTGIDPSHTQVAKDDPDHPLHHLAASLAIHAVREVGNKMIDVWNGNADFDKDVLPIVDKIVRHPVVSDWQDSIVTEWARKNPDKLCQASSPSVVIDRLMHAIHEIEETLNELQKQLKDDIATGKIMSYFSVDEKTKKDFKALEQTIVDALEKSRQQRNKLLQIKATWDKKYPKPQRCLAKHFPPAKPSKSDGNLKEVFMHFVKQGETLWDIAKNHQTTVDALKYLNNLKTDEIKIDQILKLP